MTRAVVFRTPGLIDIRAFTVFGVNAKPNSQNPIGYFGTGLKYALAVLIRLGVEPTVWIGRDQYRFHRKTTGFRDKEFDFISMRRQRWSALRHTSHQLPFTTGLGRNWQMWQAYRELEANTRDEGGNTLLVTPGVEQGSYFVQGEVETLRRSDDTTLIVIESDDFAECHLNRDDVFLPGAAQARSDDTGPVQVFEGQTKRVYYRGLRVRDLEKPSLYTYNFLDQQELTEDRTLKYDFWARRTLAQHVAGSRDAGMIERVLTASDDYWEHGLDFDGIDQEPSPEFLRVAQRRRGALSPSAGRYAGGWFTGSSRQTTWQRHPAPWRRHDWARRCVLDAEGEEVLQVGNGVHDRHVDQFVTDLLDTVNTARKVEVEEVAPETEEEAK